MTSHAHPSDIAATNQPGTLLTIAASAEASRAPDIATVSTGVVTQSVEANTAMRNNAVKMDKVMAALRAAGRGEGVDQMMAAALRPYRRRTRANMRRLSRKA